MELSVGRAGSKHTPIHFSERRYLIHTRQHETEIHTYKTRKGAQTNTRLSSFILQQITECNIRQCVCEENGDLPLFCGSALYPARIRACEAPWIRHTKTQPGPPCRSCTTSRCSPSERRETRRCRKMYRGREGQRQGDKSECQEDLRLYRKKTESG